MRAFASLSLFAAAAIVVGACENPNNSAQPATPTAAAPYGAQPGAYPQGGYPQPQQPPPGYATAGQYPPAPAPAWRTRAVSGAPPAADNIYHNGTCSPPCTSSGTRAFAVCDAGAASDVRPIPFTGSRRIDGRAGHARAPVSVRRHVRVSPLQHAVRQMRLPVPDSRGLHCTERLQHGCLLAHPRRRKIVQRIVAPVFCAHRPPRNANPLMSSRARWSAMSAAHTQMR